MSVNTIRSILKSENKYKDIDNSEFKKISADFKKKLSSKECTYHKLLPDAFALVKEAAKRALGLNIYKTQLLCGIKLSKGYIAEMKTGEGKTLAAVAPAYLYALLGKCHIVTVNDYLAKTNSEQMSKVFSLLGLTTGCITAGLAPYERKRQYDCDIIYGTNQEFCFDYLRDNLRVAKDKIQTSLDYAIIDEIDSILIDDARTPLIISSEKELNNEMLLKADKFVKTLSEGKKIRKKLIYKALNTTSSLDMLYTGDYVINRNNNTIFLTEKGIIKAEEYFDLDYYASEENIPLIGAISNALRANYMFEKDKDYVVSIDTVDIVDPSTGRIMIGRKYSDGLHQALEAKENVKITPITYNKAVTSYKNYFSLYKKICGMTGTATTEKKEFKKIYGLKVTKIPTYKKSVRKDLKDRCFVTKEDKYKAIIDDIKNVHSKGQPILVGTSSVQESEQLSELLTYNKIEHNVLNAKNNENEATIIARAGRLNAVTIATNMAGRGTDIILGGNPNEMSQKEWQNEHSKVVELGGLCIIASERNFARRIDNQLIGRAGRQGDPGVTCFYVSAEDYLVGMYNKDKSQKLISKKKLFFPSSAIKHIVKITQKQCQDLYYEQRKFTTQFDDVDVHEREYIYSLRENVIYSEEPYKYIDFFMRKAVKFLMESYTVEDILNYALEEWQISIKKEDLLEKAKPSESKLISLIKDKYSENLVTPLNDEHFEQPEFERRIILQYIDEEWIEYLNAIARIADIVTLSAYGATKPIEIYKEKTAELHTLLLYNISLNIVKHLMQMKTHNREIHLDVLKNANIKII